MYKKSFITSIVLTILNLFPTLFCLYLNSLIVYEGEGALGLLAIIPYTFILLPIILLFFILGLVFSLKARKSESKKIRITSIVFTCINILIAIAVVVIIARIIPLWL